MLLRSNSTGNRAISSTVPFLIAEAHQHEQFHGRAGAVTCPPRVGGALMTPMRDAHDDLAHQVEAQVGSRPPEALLDVWTGAALVDGSADVYLYGPAEIAERNATYEVPTYRPDLLLIGDDGGGRGLFVPRDDPDPDLYLIGLGAVGSDEGERVATLTELAADAFRAMRIGDPADDWPPPAGPIDVLISHRPAAGTKALVEIRKLLGLDIPISELLSADVTFPMVVLTGVRYPKYATAITDLNQRFGCLAIRPRLA